MANGWHVGKFGDVLEPVSRPVQVEADKVYRNLGVQWYAYGLFVREEKPGHEIRAKELYRVDLGDLVYNRLFAWKGSFAIADKDTAGGYVSGEFPCFRVNTERANAKYLHLYLSQKKIWEEIERISTGQTSISRLRFKEAVFLGMDIPLPPLDEQHRIVEYVEALAARIAKAQFLRKEADMETEALFASGTRKIFDKHSWKMISIEELVGRENLKNGKSLKSDEQPSEVSCLRISAMRNGKIDCKDTKPISMTAEEAKQYRVHINDVFIVRGNGSKELVGRAGLIEECKNIVIFPDLFIRVPLDETKVLPTFFVTWWNSPVMREKIVDLAKTTSGIWKINQGHIASCEIPVPPLDEQRRIVAYLDSVQARLASLRELQSATGEELSALLPSVLDRAFKGEL